MFFIELLILLFERCVFLGFILEELDWVNFVESQLFLIKLKFFGQIVHFLIDFTVVRVSGIIFIDDSSDSLINILLVKLFVSIFKWSVFLCIFLQELHWIDFI